MNIQDFQRMTLIRQDRTLANHADGNGAVRVNEYEDADGRRYQHDAQNSRYRVAENGEVHGLEYGDWIPCRDNE